MLGCCNLGSNADNPNFKKLNVKSVIKIKYKNYIKIYRYKL